MVTTSSGSCGKESIDCTKVDVLAAYIESLDIFYNIPCLELDSAKRISLYPHNIDSKAKHEKFKESWEAYKIS
jgi:hypothetical protein